MNKKIVKKLLIIILLFVFMIIIGKTNVEASIYTGINLGTNDASGSQDIGNKIFGTIQVIGIVSSVVILSIIGIKYMTSTVQERAERKGMLMLYIIGAVLVFGISNFAKVIYIFISGITTN